MKSYLTFVTVPMLKRKTAVRAVVSRTTGETLGTITWANGWRQYAFWPRTPTLWSDGCLEEIQGEIKRLMEDRVARAVASSTTLDADGGAVTVDSKSSEVTSR